MRVLGVKSVKVTNARGFCLEISTAITVVIASRIGVASSVFIIDTFATAQGPLLLHFVPAPGPELLERCSCAALAAFASSSSVPVYRVLVIMGDASAKTWRVLSLACRVAGLPVSTTQVLCGAIFAIGLFEGGKGLNWRVALKVGASM